MKGKKLINWQRIKDKKCPFCGIKFVKGYDNVARTYTPYLFEPACKCFPQNIQINIG